jgi:threonine/homoserine/homoserine lactone efflux protein
MLPEMIAFLSVCILVICTPGPDTALTVRNSIIGRRRGGLFTAGGIAAGQLVWTVAASIGLTGLLQASQPAFAALKIIGAAYLIFLGAQSILAGVRGHSSHAERKADMVGVKPWQAWRQGLISNLGNPKMVVFFLSLLPQFVPAASGGFAAFLPLGLVFCLMTFGWLSLYAVLLHRLRTFFQRPHVRRIFNAVTGSVLVAFGLRLATQQRA